MTARCTTDQFITKARQKHGSKYDYSLVQYTTTHTKVTILCPLHGAYEQRPNRHLSGDGCPVCGDARSGAAKTNDTQHFINQATIVHGTTYDYALVSYSGINELVTIICKQHGEFKQRASDHIHSGAGCPLCGNDGKRQSKLKSPDQIVYESNKTHGSKYSYDLESIHNTSTKMVVTCTKHGPFHVTPSNHIHNKSGCPKCNASSGERLIQLLLEDNDVLYETQHTFPQCVSPKGYPLRFDFFLPGFNIVIEYDGEQHYHPTRMRGVRNAYDAEQLHQSTKINDNIKNEYVATKGIRIVRIPYYEKHNISAILQINNII